jgi:hypothetical protein
MPAGALESTGDAVPDAAPKACTPVQFTTQSWPISRQKVD